MLNIRVPVIDQSITHIVYEIVKADIGLISGRKGAKSGNGSTVDERSRITLINKNQLSISDAHWKRLGQRAVSKCRLVARSNGLVVSGMLNPTQPLLLSLPNLLRAPLGYLGETDEL